jgi:type IV pilus assembly protein PilC
MAEFIYEGVDREGKRATGRLEGTAEGDVRMALRNMGVRPKRITPARVAGKSGGLFGSQGGARVPLVEVLVFIRQLQVLISSGVPLVQSLEILADQASNKILKVATLTIRDRVSSGSFFWEAISAYPLIFPKLGIALIQAGEASGSLDVMLKRLTRYLEDTDRLQRTVKGAMMYPAIVVLIGIIVVAGMLVGVVPKFEAMLTSSGQELPGPTRVVVDISHFLVNNFPFIAIAVVVGGFVAANYLRSKEGKAFLDRTLFRAPLFGPLMQKSGVARFSRTMNTLLVSGVSLLDAIDICKNTVDNAVLEDAIAGIRSEVEAGKTLGSVVSRIEVFPRMAVQMMAVGESTGALDRMLEKVADFYEMEVETSVAGLTRLIEPLVLVVLGGAVGGILIAMYLPIFQMAGGGE